MKKAQKSLYNSKARPEKISENLSSGIIIDFQDLEQQSFIKSVQNKFINNLNLKKTELVFSDFKRKEFPDFAKTRYHEMQECLKKKRKMDLMNILSMSLYELFKQNIKNNVQLPFELYSDVLDVQIAQDRIYKDESLGGGQQFTWHQITCKFTYGYETRDIIKHNVYERRECDLKSDQWRICHLD